MLTTTGRDRRVEVFVEGQRHRVPRLDWRATPTMICPYCGSRENRVINSRESQGGAQVRRRRHCDDCGERFTTRETIERRELFVVKSDETREPYDRAKVLRGITIACRKRPVELEQMESVVATIERSLEKRKSGEIHTNEIGKLILHQLRHIDEVAYVRFASVYRNFGSIGEFGKELKKLAAS